ncbi:MAG TPA: hypothetical protein ENI11_04565 [Actinobacteria bacterium]|nr:hypothetical protein [Actinomycetota bacterium]
MKCEDIEEQLSAYIDNELPDTEMATVEQHLLRCAACAKSLAQLKRIADMVGNVAPVSMSKRASKQLETAIEERLYTPEPEIELSEKPAWWRWLTRPAFGAVAASVAVLALAVLVVSSPMQQNRESLLSQKTPSKSLSGKADNAEKISPEIGAAQEYDGTSEQKDEAPADVGRDANSDAKAQITRKQIDALAKKLSEQPPSDTENNSRNKTIEPLAESELEDDAAKNADKIDAARAASIAAKKTPFKLLSASVSQFENEEAWIVTFEVLGDDQDTSRRFRAAAVSTAGRLLYRTN